ncbi:MAG: Kelch repeat-containing protein [Nitrososphaeraceae archaeon]
MKKRGVVFIFVFLLMLLSMGYTEVSAQEFNGWRERTNMPTARGYVKAIELNGKIYVMGGWDGNKTIKTVEQYDPVTDRWTTKENMTTVRSAYGAVAVDDKIYVFGGRKDNNVFISTVEEYNTITDTWTTKADMPIATSDLMVAEFNGKIYLFGGYTESSNLSTVYEYDPQMDTWTSKTNMPTARYGGEAQVVDGKIYVIGGRIITDFTSRKYKDFGTVEEYDPVSDKWSTKTNMPTARCAGASAVLNDNIYFVGGYNGDTFSKVEKYNVDTDTWTSEKSLLASKYYIGAAVLNGRIYVLGGYNRNKVLSTVEESYYLPDAPTNLTATPDKQRIKLSWNAVEGATSYIVKRTTRSGESYTILANDISGTNYLDTDVTVGTTYYYVVCAKNDDEVSEYSNEASATPEEPTNNRALLVITMQNGLEKEYDMSMNEINDFIEWYDIRTEGNGKAYYKIVKDYNIGTFESRKDYIVYNKINCFEVLEYLD